MTFLGFELLLGEELITQARVGIRSDSEADYTSPCQKWKLQPNVALRYYGAKNTCIKVSQIRLQEQNIRDVHKVQGTPLYFQEGELLFEASYPLSTKSSDEGLPFNVLRFTFFVQNKSYVDVQVILMLTVWYFLWD